MKSQAAHSDPAEEEPSGRDTAPERSPEAIRQSTFRKVTLMSGGVVDPAEPAEPAEPADEARPGKADQKTAR